MSFARAEIPPIACRDETLAHGVYQRALQRKPSCSREHNYQQICSQLIEENARRIRQGVLDRRGRCNPGRCGKRKAIAECRNRRFVRSKAIMENLNDGDIRVTVRRQQRVRPAR
jgi:hypothetical protein